jgi:hypothetical protein
MINLRNTAPGHDAATVENYVRVQVAQALQIAIERQQAEIIKMLFVQQEKAIGLLDFLSLYRLDHPFFATSAVLTAKLAEGAALDSFGKATPIALYEQVLLPFLRDFVPGIDYALQREQQREPSTRANKSSRALLKPTPQYFADGLPHLMLWAVFIGSVELARVFWQQSTKHSDPIRMALIAAQVSKESAEVRPSAAALCGGGSLNKPVPGEKKTRFPRSTGVQGSRARCSLMERSHRVPVFFHRLERAYMLVATRPPPWALVGNPPP